MIHADDHDDGGDDDDHDDDLVITIILLSIMLMLMTMLLARTIFIDHHDDNENYHVDYDYDHHCHYDNHDNAVLSINSKPFLDLETERYFLFSLRSTACCHQKRAKSPDGRKKHTPEHKNKNERGSTSTQGNTAPRAAAAYHPMYTDIFRCRTHTPG